jgi:hypothetical protein
MAKKEIRKPEIRQSKTKFSQGSDGQIYRIEKFERVTRDDRGAVKHTWAYQKKFDENGRLVATRGNVEK